MMMTELHDIGKLFISWAILEKPERLSKEERQEMENHALYGYLIAHSSLALREIAPIILMHHERLDGSGYPIGLAGEEIPPAARLVSLLDAYDAMVNDRPYRKALSAGAAIEEIESKLHTQFDPTLGFQFLHFVKGNA